MSRRITKRDMDDVLGWAVGLRRSLRSALFPYYPNNPASGDEELISTVKELVQFWIDSGKPKPAYQKNREAYAKQLDEYLEKRKERPQP